jgi:RNA polymerase sigma-70 factor (ECF subfamily)
VSAEDGIADVGNGAAQSTAVGATEAAIEAIYRQRFHQFVRVAPGVCEDPDAAADVVHDAFAAALRSRGAFRASGSLEGWLWRTVVNAARNHRRRAILGRLRLTSPESRRDAAPVVEEPGDPAVRALIVRLPRRQRTVLFFRYYGGLENAEIAVAPWGSGSAPSAQR